MTNANTIFGRDTPPTTARHFTPKKQQPKPKKKRIDAKKDIKFRLSPGDKKILKLAAMDHNLSLTAFSSLIVEKELMREKEYQDFNYDNTGDFVHVMLKKDLFIMLQTLAVDLNLPLRRLVHRMIKDYIFTTTGGVEIIDYRRAKG